MKNIIGFRNMTFVSKPYDNRSFRQFEICVSCILFLCGISSAKNCGEQLRTFFRARKSTCNQTFNAVTSSKWARLEPVFTWTYWIFQTIVHALFLHCLLVIVLVWVMFVVMWIFCLTCMSFGGGNTKKQPIFSPCIVYRDWSINKTRLCGTLFWISFWIVLKLQSNYCCCHLI